MRNVFYYGMILFLLSNFVGLSETTDVRSNIKLIFNIGDWIINPVKYTGIAEIIYIGDENISIFRSLFKTSFFWGLLLLGIIAIFIYLKYTKPSPKHVRRDSIIIGTIWSLSYLILWTTSNFWWHNDSLRGFITSWGGIIWFPHAILTYFFIILTGYYDSPALVLPGFILGLPISIFVVYKVLKMWRREK